MLFRWNREKRTPELNARQMEMDVHFREHCFRLGDWRIHYQLLLCHLYRYFYSAANRETCLYMVHATQKRVFTHVRVTKAQLRLRNRAVWSGPSLSSNRIIGYYLIYDWRAKPRMILCACAGWFESAHFAHVRRHFSAWRGLYTYYVQL